jgi:hypothetical protein
LRSGPQATVVEPVPTEADARSIPATPDKFTFTPEISDAFTDSSLAEWFSFSELAREFRWDADSGWWGLEEEDGREYWRRVPTAYIVEIARMWAHGHYCDRVNQAREFGLDSEAVDEIQSWRSVLSAKRLKAIVKLARGMRWNFETPQSDTP